MKDFSWGRILQVIGENIGGFLPIVLAALVVLFVGWIAALFVSRLVRRGMGKLGLNERLGRWMEGPAGAVDVERGASRVVYWLLMILVSVAFFQTLGLTLITEPLNNLLNQVFAFLPQILSAVILLLIAWVLANIVRALVPRLLSATRFEERLGPPEGEERRAPLSHTIGDVAYWLVFLLFLPAVVGALALEGLLGPVQSMMNNMLTFLPNILAAALILVSGWFLARVLRRVVTNLLAGAGADRLSERVGLVAGLGEQRLSGLIGLILYALVLIPVLIAALNALQLESITEPTSNMLDSILQAIPNIFAAALVIAIAFVVGRLVADLISRILSGIGFDRVLIWLGIGAERVEGAWTPSGVVGHVILVAMLLFATMEGLQLLGFEALADLVSRSTVFAAQILFGLAVFAVGLILSNLAVRAVVATGIGNATLLAVIARASILVLAGAMALLQMGIADQVVIVAFTMLGGSLAVAAAIAFGLGGREPARQLMEEWIESIRKRD